MACCGGGAKFTRAGTQTTQPVTAPVQRPPSPPSSTGGVVTGGASYQAPNSPTPQTLPPNMGAWSKPVRRVV